MRRKTEKEEKEQTFLTTQPETGQLGFLYKHNTT